ncbi:MAG: trypsin-like serine protease [Bacteroidetes bacterium]|nr:trypsin-like serine protease [Bacteroidota bacterium]
MTNDNDSIITKLTVRLQDNVSLNYIGTGIIYYESSLYDKVYILTASHCLFEDGDAFKNPRKQVLINIFNPDLKEYNTVEYIVDPQFLSNKINQDLAVFIIDKKIIDEIVNEIPIIESVKERSTYTKFVVKGFPKATQGEELAVLYPTWLQAIEIDNRFQIQLNEDYSDYNTQGFSGSGVFLIAGNKIYLYGILTRFRKEEKGKVIYCQYIETVNKLLSNNYCTQIRFSYFENYGLNPTFFVKQIEKSVVELGPRFNEKLNFRLPIAKLFNDIAKDSLFWHRFLNIIDNWILERNYGGMHNNIHLSEIEGDFEKFKQDVGNWGAALKISIEESIEVEWILDQHKILCEKIDKKVNELYDLRRDEERKNQMNKQANKSKKSANDYNYKPPYDNEIHRLREIDRINSNFINGILKDINLNLANKPVMILDGDAGNGKSHLFADIATSRVSMNLPTLLLLGQNFSSSINVWNNIIANLHISCTKGDLLEALNNIGKQIGSRVMVLIDAINEGPGRDLWNTQIAGFIHDFHQYPYIGLAITIRTTYIDFVIPENVRNNSYITFKTHEGFKGNEYAALKLFCEFHEIDQPDFPILAPEFTKPLFYN